MTKNITPEDMKSIELKENEERLKMLNTILEYHCEVKKLEFHEYESLGHYTAYITLNIPMDVKKEENK